MKIIETARALPEKIVTNDELRRFVDTNDEWIRKRTGIGQRYISGGENTSELCIKAAEELLRKSRVKAEEIDLIIVCTFTPDYLTPTVACLVQGAIGALNACAFDLNAACSGFVYGYSAAAKFLASGSYRKALLIGGDVVSKVLDWGDRSSCVLFGDGAGGLLLEAADYGGLLAEDLHTDGGRWGSLTAGMNAAANPYIEISGEDANLKMNGTAAAENSYLKMNGREIFDFAVKAVPESIREVLRKADLSLGDIKTVVPHQANSRIIEVIAKKLGIPAEKFYMNMERYGNTSAASIPIALDELREQPLLKEGDLVILAGFGGGLTWGSLLITI